MSLGWLLLISSPGPLRAGEPIVIGMSAAFKGPSRGLGIELYRGSMAYFEYINRGGGIHGRKIVVRAYDDGYNPTPAIANTIRLIKDDKVFLLYGYVGTPTVTRILPLLKRYSRESIFLFFPFTGAEPQRQAPYNEFVFNLRPSYRDETAGLVQNFLKIGRNKIAVFYQIDPYGRSGFEGVRTALAKKGLSIVSEATYKRGTPSSASLRRQVALVRKGQPDAVICVGAYAACAAFIRDARDTGWDVPIANVSFVGSENLLGLLVQMGKTRNKDYTRNLINSQVVPSYHNRAFPAVREYQAFMKKYHPQLPPALAADDYEPLPNSFVGFEGFLNAKLLVAILKKMGKRQERNRIKQVVESVDNLDLGIGERVSFRADKHQGLDQVYYTVVTADGFGLVQNWRRWRK
jgi:ABC-type branched-subunit amino acid transport system substrate-binding protein